MTPNRSRRALFCALATAFGLWLAPALARAEAVLVFAAASLADALDAAIEASGVEARASYASSSTLARQIEQGAPADLFVSANPEWMDWLQVRGLIEPTSRRDLLGNQLVLVATEGRPLVRIALPVGIAAVLGDDGRLAVGDPDHVPAGIYAKQALTYYGLWAELRPRLARADNVRGALRLVETGQSPLGIVYASDALASDGAYAVATFAPESHEHIVYPIALTRDHGPEARKLLRFLKTRKAAAIFERYGFEPLLP